VVSGAKPVPLWHWRGHDIREALRALRSQVGDRYERLRLGFVNPATGAPLFPTLGYSAQLLRPGEVTRFKRQTANHFYVVLPGSGFH
jgi:gentisate 1,2-dioxygenase